MKINALQFFDGLNFVLPLAGFRKPDLEENLAGVNLELNAKEGEIILVSTNGSLLGLKRIKAKVDGPAEDFALVIRRSDAEILKKLGKKSKDCTIQYDGSCVTFETGKESLTFNPVLGKFPDWRLAIEIATKQTKYFQFKVNSRHLLSALKALDDMLNDKWPNPTNERNYSLNKPIHLEWEDSSLIIKGKYAYGEFFKKIEAHTDKCPDSLSLLVDLILLKKCLEKFKGEIELHLPQESTKAIQVFAYDPSLGENELRLVLMPMRK